LSPTDSCLTAEHAAEVVPLRAKPCGRCGAADYPLDTCNGADGGFSIVFHALEVQVFVILAAAHVKDARQSKAPHVELERGIVIWLRCFHALLLQLLELVVLGALALDQMLGLRGLWQAVCAT